ncbi:MAG: hypothetical protein HQM09_01370 [Candidatus Riflebacteria bacterium]|nr:hypothetical protein [Candidatus Riflebacteria bacterium]
MHLKREDRLAIELAVFTLDTFVATRNRKRVRELLSTAPDSSRNILWNRLSRQEPRNLWLLNPLFEAAGLPARNSFPTIDPDSMEDNTTYLQAVAYPREKWAVNTLVSQPDSNAFFSVTSMMQKSNDTREIQPYRQDSNRMMNLETFSHNFHVAEGSPDKIPSPVFRKKNIDKGALSADAPEDAAGFACRILNRAISIRNSETVCELFEIVPTWVRSQLWRYFLTFHDADLDLLNPIFERCELPPIERGDRPIAISAYREALWNEI